MQIYSKDLTDSEKITDISKKTTDIYKILSKVTLEFSGTEYNAGDNGTVFLQLLNNSGFPVNNGYCYLTIYYPNKTIMLNNTFMTYQLNSDGIYYYDLIIPQQLGVYILSAKCDYYINLTYNTPSADTFISNSSNNTNYGNLTYMTTGKGSGTAYYSYTQFDTTNISSDGLVDAELYLYTSLGLVNTPNVTIQHVTSVWNETNVTWNTKPTNNNIIYDGRVISSSGWYRWNITNLMMNWLNGNITNYGMLLNISQASWQGSGSLNSTNFQTRESSYKPYLILEYRSVSYINEIRGSGEIHVINFNCSNMINYTDSIISINDTIKNVNSTQNNNFINLNSNMLGNFSNTNNLINLLSGYINSNFTNTNNLINSLDVNMANNFTYLNSVINSMNNDINGNITNLYNIIYSLNGSMLNASDVWNYPNRTIDNVTFVTNVANVTNVQNVTSLSDNVYDEIALRVIQYFTAFKDKLLTWKLF
jgi:hypothetical protein